MGRQPCDPRPVNGYAEPRRCLVCQGPLALFGPYGDYTYFRCQDCKTIQLCPMPSEADLLEEYANNYDSSHQVYDSHQQVEAHADPEWWRHSTRTYLDAMIRTLKDHHVSTVVDCGAGWGFLVERMIAEGFAARGVELSHKQVVYGRARGLPVQQGSLDALTGFDGEISAITLLAVFEHLINHTALLVEARRLLRDDGLLITAHPTQAGFNLVGNLMRLGNKRRQLPSLAGALAAPWHTVLFSIEGTKQLVCRQGFRLVEIRPLPQGRFGGPLGAIQVGVELANRIGWKIAGPRWPGVTTHIFVFRKCGPS